MSLFRMPVTSGRSVPAAPEDSQRDAQAWRELGLDSLLAGEPASGLWYLRNAIEIDADDPATWQLMGRCFDEMGEESRARKCYILALRQHALPGVNTQSAPTAPLPMFWRRRPARDV